MQPKPQKGSQGGLTEAWCPAGPPEGPNQAGAVGSHVAGAGPALPSTPARMDFHHALPALYLLNPLPTVL